ncbi:hypothetical protein H4R33_006853 [Dimargaris cristalligena]|nr:hypothetical protein H4R33_006853 [Dimargaris cristalligena]
MRAYSFWAILATALLGDLPSTTGQLIGGPSSVAFNTVPHNYIVKFNGNPGDPIGADSFFAQMAALGIPYTITANYSVLLNGVSLEVDDQYNDAMASLPGVQIVWPLGISSLDAMVLSSPPSPFLPTLSPKPMLAHNYTGVNNVQNVLNVTGRNVKIGVLDSGIDYNHPAFGSCFKTPGCRLQYGYDFVGDFFSGKNAVPDSDPFDPCQYHGTHVTGILAGNDGDFKGVAPDATIGVYRVLGCYNIVTESIVVQALEQAYLDGMNIVTMSIGFPGAWGASASGDASATLVQQGVFVVSAAGNQGKDGMWSINGPSVRNSVVSVGSAEMPFHYSQYLNVTSDELVGIRRTMSQGYLPALNLNQVQIVRGLAAGSTTDDYGCNALPIFTGKVVLVQNGGCNMYTKALNVQNAGGVLMVVYQSDSGDPAAVVYESLINFPSVAIYNADAVYMIKKMNTTTIVTVSAGADSVIFDSFTPRAPSDFSSWGPGPESEVKPELLGPGSNIYAPWPLGLGSYGIVSGTSMSTPYVAGVAALAIEYGKANIGNGTLTAIVNTARPQINAASLTYYPVIQQGAGIVNGYGAVTSQIIFNVTTINGTFPDSDWRDFDMFFSYNNTGGAAWTYKLQSINAQSVSGFDNTKTLAIPPITNKKTPDVWLSTTSLKANAGKMGYFNINIDHSSYERPDLFVYNGYLIMYPTAGVSTGFNYTIPFSGLSYFSSQVPLIPPLTTGLPCLVQYQENVCLSELRTFQIPNNYPALVFRLQHPIYRLRIRIAKAATPTSVHASVVENHYFDMSRNFQSVGSMNYTYAWNGKVFYSDNPTQLVYPSNGDYVFLIFFYTYNSGSTPIIWNSNPMTIKGP